MDAEHVSPPDAWAAAERAARASYGRLVALLAASTGDLALAEDALSGAFEQALTTWADAGVPANPEGWLLTVARNRQRDVWKSPAHRATRPLDAGGDDHSAADAVDRRLGAVASIDPIADVDPFAIPDKRLELLFVCAHPAIDPAVRTPLMLQVVLGFEASQVAAAFAVPPAAMAQRLVRAKRRIRDTRIPFAVPDRRAMAERLPPVLEAVYGCHAIAWREGAGSLAGEAQYLAVTLAALLEREPEAWGLAALVTLSLARQPAIRARADRPPFVPLDEQDPATWDAALIAEGEEYLRRVSEHAGPPGRFQLEAAIQAVHCDRRRSGAMDWRALRTLYLALDGIAPSLGARVALAAVTGRIDGPDAGLAALPPEPADGFQPWWAARADLLDRAGRSGEAAEAYARAADLADDAAVRDHLLARRRRLEGG